MSSWPVPETQFLILGEVKPQCPVLHIVQAAQHKVQLLSTGTLLLYLLASPAFLTTFMVLLIQLN